MQKTGLVTIIAAVTFLCLSSVCPLWWSRIFMPYFKVKWVQTVMKPEGLTLWIAPGETGGTEHQCHPTPKRIAPRIVNS
jgi:hypothetical protein